MKIIIFILTLTFSIRYINRNYSNNDMKDANMEFYWYKLNRLMSLIKSFRNNPYFNIKIKVGYKTKNIPFNNNFNNINRNNHYNDEELNKHKYINKTYYGSKYYRQRYSFMNGMGN